MFEMATEERAFYSFSFTNPSRGPPNHFQAPTPKCLRAADSSFLSTRFSLITGTVNKKSFCSHWHKMVILAIISPCWPSLHELEEEEEDGL